MSGLLDVVEVTGPGRGRDAGLDEDAVTDSGGGDVAGTQIAYGAFAQRQDAAEADAHAASRRHQHTGRLADIEKGRGAVRLDGRAGSGERHAAALARHE